VLKFVASCHRPLTPFVSIAPVFGVNYFFGLTTTISPYQRQLPFKS
jgi:hypothetical protein